MSTLFESWGLWVPLHVRRRTYIKKIQRKYNFQFYCRWQSSAVVIGGRIEVHEREFLSLLSSFNFDWSPIITVSASTYDQLSTSTQKQSEKPHHFSVFRWELKSKSRVCSRSKSKFISPSGHIGGLLKLSHDKQSEKLARRESLSPERNFSLSLLLAPRHYLLPQIQSAKAINRESADDEKNLWLSIIWAVWTRGRHNSKIVPFHLPHICAEKEKKKVVGIYGEMRDMR